MKGKVGIDHPWEPCSICGKYRKGVPHIKCSKIRQAYYKQENENKNPKRKLPKKGYPEGTVKFFKKHFNE